MSPREPYDDRYGPPSPVFRMLGECADTATRVRWLWPERLPLGAVSLLIGDPGVGKSLLTADLAARVSVPRAWPDDPACERPDPATMPAMPDVWTEEAIEKRYPPLRGFNTREIAPTAVVFVSPEDQAVLPKRLAAAGAEPLRVSMLDGVRPPYSQEVVPLRLPEHAEQLAQAIRAHDHPRLVVLDPIHLLVEDGVHTSAAHQTGLVSRLAAMARQYDVAVLVVGHFSKSWARRVLYRIRGSLSMVAAARSILLVTADPVVRERRILTQVKNAYGPLAPPLAFRIVDGPRLEWDESGAGDWRLATAALDLSAEGSSALSEACDWLGDFLAGGPRAASEVLAEARGAGIPRVTLFRAKRVLGVGSRKTGGAWEWVVSTAVEEDVTGRDADRWADERRTTLPEAHGGA